MKNPKQSFCDTLETIVYGRGGVPLSLSHNISKLVVPKNAGAAPYFIILQTCRVATVAKGPCIADTKRGQNVTPPLRVALV